MNAGANDTTPGYLHERLAAMETLLAELLPMLIQDSPHESDICSTLKEWTADPPVQMQGNLAFSDAVQELLDYLPNA